MGVFVDAVIELEDADATLLKELSAQMQWAVVHEDIVKFGEVVKNM